MHDIQKHFAIFLCFHILFWKISGFFCLNLVISVQKNHLKKKSDSHNFSLVFLLTLFSLFCFVSLCLLSLLLVFSFSTLFLFFSLPFFSFPISSPYVCLSLCLFTLSLLCFPFCENSLLFLFFFQKKKNLLFHFFIPFFVKLFLFHLLCCFVPFPVCFCFFNRVLSNKINWLFFWQKNHLFNTSKNLFFWTSVICF